MQLSIRVSCWFSNFLFVLQFEESFILGFATFEDLMLKGAAKDTWINICEKVGQFLATTKNNFNGVDVSKALQNESIR